MVAVLVAEEVVQAVARIHSGLALAMASRRMSPRGLHHAFHELRGGLYLLWDLREVDTARQVAAVVLPSVLGGVVVGVAASDVSVGTSRFETRRSQEQPGDRRSGTLSTRREGFVTLA